MFDGLRFRYEVWKLRRKEARQIEAIDWKSIARAEALGKQHDIWAETDAFIDYLHTHYLFSELDKLRLPRPQLTEENWTGGPPLGNVEWLTKPAILELREAIRKERKERSEITRLWLGTFAPIISALTGLVGAAIGLLAFLSR